MTTETIPGQTGGTQGTAGTVQTPDYSKIQAEATAKATEVANEVAGKKANAVFTDMLKQQGIEGDTLKNMLAEYQSKQMTPEKALAQAKSQYDTLKTEFDSYKLGVERGEKQRVVEEHLTSANVKPSLKGLIAKEFDISKIELENGKIKDWDNILKPVKEKYADSFGTVTIQGAPPAAGSQGNQESDPSMAGFDKIIQQGMRPRK